MRIAGYEWKDGARVHGGIDHDANEVGRHLEFLKDQFKGELTPKDVLDDARNPNSPLHRHFEWDDGAAAEAYRMDQARGLIRAVVAIYVSDEKPATRVRAFVHIPEPGAPHYRATGHAMSQVKTRDLVLKQALRELQAWRQKYKDLKEFAALFDAVDEAARKLPRSH